jgi:hypothetical protein
VGRVTQRANAFNQHTSPGRCPAPDAPRTARERGRGPRERKAHAERAGRSPGLLPCPTFSSVREPYGRRERGADRVWGRTYVPSFRV